MGVCATNFKIPSYTELIARVCDNDPEGIERLRQEFSRGIRFFLSRELRDQGIDESLEEVLLQIFVEMRKAHVQADKVLSLVRLVLRRYIAEHKARSD